jgi:hypothetical protein
MSPLKSYAEILTLPGDITRKWSLWDVIGHESGTVLNEISALLKEPPEISLCPFYHVKETLRRQLSMNQKGTLTRL